MDHINAKIRAMRARLITTEQYQILCRSQSTEHFLAQLRTYPAYTHGRISMSEETERIRLFLTGSGVASCVALGGRMGSAASRWSRFIALEKDYMQAWSWTKTLPNGSNRQALTYIKGTEIDLHNLFWIYRLKQYYPEAEVYPHLVPVCYRLNKETLRQMAESPGVAEFIVHLRHTYYSHVFDSFENPEYAITLAMKSVFSKMARRYPRSIAGVIGYVFDKRVEVRNLTAAMEGIQYRLGPEEVFKCLYV